MRLSQKTSTVESAVELKRLARLVLERAGESRGADLPDPIPPETIWKLRRALADVSAPGVQEQLILALNAVVERRDAISRATIVWLDLLEALVQNTERRYGQVGRGRLKKEEVKTVVSYLIRGRRFRIPHVPDYLQPVVVDVVADFAIDAIVALSNQNDLWIVGEHRTTISGLYRWLKHAIGRVLRPLFEPLGRLVSAIYFRIRYPVPLSPALRSALKAVERDGWIAQDENAVERVIALKVWIADHSDALVALVRLVSLVVTEVERLLDMSGAEKKAYAKQIVFEVLRDLGFDTSSFFFTVKVEAGVDLAIDAVVHMFHKRGLFVHRTRRAAPMAASVR